MSSTETELTDEEAFAVIEGLADAASVAHVIGHDDSVEDALEEIQSIATSHHDDPTTDPVWEEQ